MRKAISSFGRMGGIPSHVTPPSAPSFSLVYGQGAGVSSGSTGSPIDYGTLNYPSGNTRVIVGIIWNPIGTSSITAVTIGGNSLTQVPCFAFSGTGGGFMDMWISTGPLSGSSGDIKVTYATTGPNGGSAVGTYGLVTTSPTVSAVNNNTSGFNGSASANTAVPTGGRAIAMAFNSAPSAVTFTNATQDDSITSGGVPFFFAHTTSTGTVTDSTNASAFTYLGLASWGT